MLVPDHPALELSSAPTRLRGLHLIPVRLLIDLDVVPACLLVVCWVLPLLQPGAGVCNVVAAGSAFGRTVNATRLR